MQYYMTKKKKETSIIYQVKFYHRLTFCRTDKVSSPVVVVFGLTINSELFYNSVVVLEVLNLLL